VTWLWSSPRYFPCEQPSTPGRGGCDKVADISARGLDIPTASGALALHFFNGDIAI
jgi:hypothetical protein